MLSHSMQDYVEMIDILLTELSPKQEAEIAVINGGWIMQTRLKELGIFAGRKIKKFHALE